MYKKKVLICDDNADFSDEINAGLEDRGYEIKLLPDATGLIKEITVFKPDLIFISMENTDPNRYPDLALLNNLTKGIPLVMLS